MEDAELNKTMAVTAGVKDNFNQNKIEEMMDIGLSLCINTIIYYGVGQC